MSLIHISLRHDYVGASMHVSKGYVEISISTILIINSRNSYFP